MAILSQDGLAPFDDVNQTTLTFGGTGLEASLVNCRKQPRDINGDGRDGLECRFDVQAARLSAASSTGIVRFQTKAGIRYQGRAGFTPPSGH